MLYLDKHITGETFCKKCRHEDMRIEQREVVLECLWAKSIVEYGLDPGYEIGRYPLFNALFFGQLQLFQLNLETINYYKITPSFKLTVMRTLSLLFLFAIKLL